MIKRALVLGAGGMSGVAWETGLLAGLADAGLDPLTFGRFVGTSSGALVSAAIASRTPMEELYDRQLGPGSAAMKATMQVDLPDLDRRLGQAVGDAEGATEIRRRMGELANQAGPVSIDDLRSMIAAELPTHAWPDHPVSMVAVDTETGAPKLLDRHSGADLVDAVAASCAIPGIWPAVPVAGRPHMDAGTRSNENLDLVTGYDRIVVLSPCGVHAPRMWRGVTLRSAANTLRATGTEVLVIEPDMDTGDHIRRNLLDPTAGAHAARAGRAQASSVVDQLAALLS